MDKETVPYIIRNATEADLPEIGKLVTQEKGWKNSANILRACFIADPNGWFVSVTNATDKSGSENQIIGVIAGCRMSDDFASGGYFLVKPDWRRRGVGRSLWDRRTAYCSGLTLSINAVDDRVEPNKKHGFSLPNQQILVWECGGEIQPGIAANAPKDCNVKISPLFGYLLPQLEVYDTRIHAGVGRVEMLTQWLDPSVTTTLVALHDDVMVGYGAVQPVDDILGVEEESGCGGNAGEECSVKRTTYHVGPLFADNDEIADVLFYQLTSSLPERAKVTWDCDYGKEHVREINKKYGFEVILKMNRMYNGKGPEVDIKSVYGLTWGGVSLF